MCGRFQGAEPAADGGAQVAGVVAGPGRVPAVGDDVRQLPEAARLQQRRRHARQAAPGRVRGPALLPPVVSTHSPTASMRSVIPALVLCVGAPAPRPAPTHRTTAVYVQSK